jgi:cytochrome c-type biogenesis protein CcmH
MKASLPVRSRAAIALGGLVLLVAVAAMAAVVFWPPGPGPVATAPAPPAVPTAMHRPASAAGPAHAASHALGSAQVAAMTERLAARLKAEPADAEGWAMLARSLASLGRLDEAVPAFARAEALRGDDAQLLADHADALARLQGRLEAGEPLALVQRALKLDADNVKALSLAGTAAFARQDYAAAVAHWERLARVGPPGHPLVQHIGVSIAEARRLGRLAPAPAAAAQAAATPPASAAARALR